jgi:hypothetical protein
VLKSRFDGGRRGGAQGLPQHPIERHANERDDRGAKPIDLRLQRAPALEVLAGPQFVDAGARPRDHVRHAKTPLRQPPIVGERDAFRYETGFVEELPEAVRRSGKVVPGLRGSNAAIDADEQDTHPRLDTIRQSELPPWLAP